MDCKVWKRHMRRHSVVTMWCVKRGLFWDIFLTDLFRKRSLAKRQGKKSVRNQWFGFLWSTGMIFQCWNDSKGLESKKVVHSWTLLTISSSCGILQGYFLKKNSQRTQWRCKRLQMHHLRIHAIKGWPRRHLIVFKLWTPSWCIFNKTPYYSATCFWSLETHEMSRHFQPVTPLFKKNMVFLPLHVLWHDNTSGGNRCWHWIFIVTPPKSISPKTAPSHNSDQCEKKWKRWFSSSFRCFSRQRWFRPNNPPIN